MIKNEGIQQISKSAQLNTEKVYEVVDEIVTTLLNLNERNYNYEIIF